MPIYEYNCRDCKQIFEDWQKDYEERELPCPVCGGAATRLISSTSFVLKGGGWYDSGYSAGQAPAAGAKGAESPAAGGAPDSGGGSGSGATDAKPAPACAPVVG